MFVLCLIEIYFKRTWFMFLSPRFMTAFLRDNSNYFHKLFKIVNKKINNY